MRRGSFASKRFGEWLENELHERKIRAVVLASKSGVGGYAISRMRHGKSTPEGAVRQILGALGYPESKAAEIMVRFGVKAGAKIPVMPVSVVAGSENWGPLCVALQVLGNYPSVEEALRVAIARELSQQSKQPPNSP